MAKAAEGCSPGFSSESAQKCSAINFWLCIDPLPHWSDKTDFQNKAATWVILQHCIHWNHSTGFCFKVQLLSINADCILQRTWVLHSQGKQSWWGKARRGFVALRDTAATCKSVSPACQFWRYFGEHRRSLQLLPRQPLEAVRKEINSLSLLEDGASTKCIPTSQPWGEWMLTLDLDPQESDSELRTLHIDLRPNT